MIKNGGTAFSNGLLVTYIKGITKQTVEMGMVRCIGLMEVIIKAIG
jgi:hypothetical protein